MDGVRAGRPPGRQERGAGGARGAGLGPLPGGVPALLPGPRGSGPRPVLPAAAGGSAPGAGGGHGAGGASLGGGGGPAGHGPVPEPAVRRPLQPPAAATPG